MATKSLHQLVRARDARGVREALQTEGGKQLLNLFDDGYTPLMWAVMDVQPSTDVIHDLLKHGARVDQVSRGEVSIPTSVMGLALGAGSPEVVSALLDAGADLHYCREGYTALIDAVHGRDVSRDPRLLDLLRLLVAHGVELNAVTRYKESGLRVLSRIGRFDGVALLLEAGADASQLQWTALHRAVALGSVADIARELAAGESLSALDWWERTPWLLAILVGDEEKARLLEEHGADTAARGRCGQTPLSFAVAGHKPRMLRRLLDLGQDVEQLDGHGGTALFDAIDQRDLECLRILLDAGADPDRDHNGRPLGHARSRAFAEALIEAGADPQHISLEARRTLLGLPADPGKDLLDCTKDEFVRDRTRRFGARNPEEMDVPFWRAMVRSGVSAYSAARHFGEPSSPSDKPVWCAQRFGQSLTFLHDGRVVQIAGEHEDHYDPDFCIYNDVFVHEPGGAIRIFGYPQDVFPPTDFHTATQVGRHIYIIGSLGYPGTRRFGETPVFRLDTASMSMTGVRTSGQVPGWISGHRATLSGTGRLIRVSGGSVALERDGKEVHEDNGNTYVLDLPSGEWRIE